MHKSSLLEIIQTFTTKELSQFKDFVNSPYFNKNENVIKLFEEIRKHAPEFTSAKLEKDKVWKKIFPGKEYNYGIMKNLIFDLNKLCEQFIVLNKFEDDEPAHNKYLLQGLFDRFLQDYFFKKLEFAEKKFDINYFKNKNYDSTDFFNFRINLYKFNQLYHQHIDRTYDVAKKINSKAANLVAGLFIEMFKTYNDTLAFSDTADVIDNPVVFFLREMLDGKTNRILDNLKNFSADGYNILKLYVLMYESFRKKGKDGSYHTFKETVFNSKKDLSDFEMRSLYSCLISSFVLNPQPGVNRDRELVEIFDSMIDRKIIKCPGEKWIEEHVFSYYIIHCANLGKPEKIRSFIEKYKNSINPEVFENMIIEINCLLSFLDKKFEEALKYLNELEFKNFGKKLLSKSMKVKLFYEMNNYESFIYEKDAYNHFLNNNKDQINLPGMTENRTSRTKNNLEVINSLFKLRNDFKKEKYFELKDLIAEKYADESWVFEKITEIEQMNGIKPGTRKLKIK